MGQGGVPGGLERAPAAQGARAGGRAAGEPILAKDGPCFPELSPLITESGQANSKIAITTQRQASFNKLSLQQALAQNVVSVFPFKPHDDPVVGRN